MPTDPFDTFKESLPGYLQEARQANSEASKALSLLMLIRRTFEDIYADKPSKLVPELERYVKVRAGTIIIRGRIDALLGNLVIELKMSLDEARLEEAKGQLGKYVAALWAIDKQRTSYMLMATDGLRFKVYKPAAPMTTEEASPDDIDLEEVNTMDIEAEAPEEAFLWLDRYVLWEERKRPTTKEMARSFGLDSPAFSSAIERLELAWRKGRIAAMAPFEEWSKYLSVVYGSALGEEALFLKHTYLATLAKLMVYAYYSEGALPSKEEIRKLLSGEAFREFGIENFLEEDFFSWLVRGEAHQEGIELAWELAKVLDRYDLSQLTEDVMKGLYQELVDPKDRHDLGEYYTPEWLAEWIVGHLLEDPTARALDPACGSGTFLAVTVRRKIGSMDMEPHLLLKHVLTSVIGIDIHPLAVLVAKANYLMALGALVKFKAGRIHVPVYLADSIQFPKARRDVEHGVEVFRYPVSKKTSLAIPAEAVEKRIVGELVEVVARFAKMIARGIAQPEPSLFDRTLTTEVPAYAELMEGSKDALWSTCQVLAQLIQANQDTIYAFIIKNIYRPATMGQFDVVMGNPPWLSYRYVRLPKYQEVLKGIILQEHKLLPPKKTELLTHMELATLFFARCADLYLKDGRKIGFVMPRAVFTADQHDNFRRGAFLPKLALQEVADLEGVKPLFKVPSAVVIAQKGEEPGAPKTALRMQGTLPEKNAHLSTVRDLKRKGEFDIERAELRLVELGERTAWAYAGEGPCGGRLLRPGPSPYMPRFREGATNVPRQVWWVEVKASPKLGVDPEKPLVETSRRATKMAKAAYRTLRMSGNVERTYLYGSLLGSDILPFCHLPIRPVILPLEPSGDRYILLNKEQVRARGHLGMARWLQEAEKEWSKRRGTKAEKMDIYQRIDRGRGITNQNPKAKFWLFYNVSGTYLAAAAVDVSRLPAVKTDGQRICLRGLIADYTTIYFATDDQREALYLEAVFNSRVTDTIIKPMQARGLWGARHIIKKPLEIGIPRFDPNNQVHKELATLAQDCAATACGIRDEFVEERGTRIDSLSPQVVGQLRSKIREALATELDKIDSLVCKILVQD